ncbi:MAG: hypothetical protein ACYC4Q_04265 [Victivallaceae bacterium]
MWKSAASKLSLFSVIKPERNPRLFLLNTAGLIFSGKSLAVMLSLLILFNLKVLNYLQAGNNTALRFIFFLDFLLRAKHFPKKPGSDSESLRKTGYIT